MKKGLIYLQQLIMTRIIYLSPWEQRSPNIVQLCWQDRYIVNIHLLYSKLSLYVRVNYNVYSKHVTYSNKI